MNNAVHSIEVAEYHISPEATEDGIIARAMEILTGRVKKGPAMSSPDVVRQYLTIKGAEHSEREVFSVMFLDSQNSLIKLVPMFFGTLNQTSVYPREVVKLALSMNAASVILTHNHPSGDVKPSSSDKLLTSTLKSALNLVDVRVVDHIITGGGSSYSMAEQGLI